MNVVYVDSSVIVALMLDQDAAHYVKRLEKSDEVVSAVLLEAEVHSAACRERLTPEVAASFIEPVSLFAPDRGLAQEYKKIYRNGYIRGAGAFHLACALYIASNPEEIYFLTADLRQQKFAEKLGFNI